MHSSASEVKLMMQVPRTCAHVNVHIESDALESCLVLDAHAADSCRVYTAGFSVPYLVIFIPILK